MKKLSAVIVFITVLFALTVTAFADCGPKPSLRLKVTGAEEQKYYITILTTGNHVPPADSAIRASFCAETTEQDIDALLDGIKAGIERFRR